jgi:protein-S-isoprenylcysteine O-methyltransferase Ste14
MSLIPAFEIGVLNAWIFMIWLLIQNLVIMVNKKLYQRFGGSSNTKPSQKDKILNLLLMLLLFLTIAYSVFLPLKLGTTWFPIGFIVFLVGLAIIIIATIDFATTPLNELVTKGAYRYSRHPGYLSLVLIYFGVSIASASWIFLVVTIIWAVVLNISVKDEELYCLERYGIAYREYMNKTPRWLGIPKIMKAK